MLPNRCGYFAPFTYKWANLRNSKRRKRVKWCISKTLTSQFGYFASLTIGVSLIGEMGKIKVTSKRENGPKVAKDVLNYSSKSLDQHYSNNAI